MSGFETMQLPEEYDDIAPDGSEIRLLSGTERGSICHCTLPAGKTSLAVEHRTVEEIWYFLDGQGEAWRRQDDHDETVPVRPGMSVTIPTGTQFQFRNAGSGPLRFLCVTMPPWPGKEEAIRIRGKWEAG